MLLGWLSKLTSGSDALSEAVDPLTGTITLSMASEPPQLDSTRATDQVSGFVLGHVMESLLRRGPGTKLAARRGRTLGNQRKRRHVLAARRRALERRETRHRARLRIRLAQDRRSGKRIRIRVLPVSAEERRSDQSRRTADRVARRARGRRPHAGRRLRTPDAVFREARRRTQRTGRSAQDFYEARNGRYGADADTMLYNGPFRITTWVHGAHLRFEKNPYYWDADRIKLNVIDIPYVTSDRERGAEPLQGRQDRNCAV